ncbi:hypothetical protein ACGF7U_15950 [Micromonospora sp. NPDC047670]|uniref:hypothetical protein n=1 Tax=Micromonospora sp. NPDC047670 TaxID=3364252 RepID=UPI003722B8AB
MSTPTTEPSRLRGRLTRVILVHGLLAAAFALLAAVGATSTARGAVGFALPWLIVGGAGALGALLVVVVAWRLRDGPAPAAPRRWPARWETSARLGMALAALAAATVGYVVAPTGSERGFVLGVNATLAGALALFALAAGDVRRVAPRSVGAARRPGRRWRRHEP